MKEEHHKKKSQMHNTNRGSLGLFLDVALEEKVYGTTQHASILPQSMKDAGSAPVFGTPSSQRPQSSKAYLQSSGHSPGSNSAHSHHQHSQHSHSHHNHHHHHHHHKPLHASIVNGHLHVDSTRLKEECIRGFEDKWFCRDDDRYNKNHTKK